MRHWPRLEESARGGEHEPAIGRDRQFGIAQVFAIDAQKSGRLPFHPVFRGDDTDGAVGGNDVVSSLSEDTEPTALVTDQVGECVMCPLVPDAPYVDNLWSGRVGSSISGY